MNRRLVATICLLASCSQPDKSPVTASVAQTTASVKSATSGTHDEEGLAAQEAALNDGKVTLSEYQAGFARWVQCAKDVGITVEAESTDPVSGLILFRVYDPGKLHEPTNPAAKCYVATFEKVDHWFGANDPVVQARTEEEQLVAYRDSLVPCLVKNGEAAEPGAKPGDAEWVRVLERVAALHSSGKC